MLFGKSRKIEEEFLKAYDENADYIFRHCYLRINDRERARELMQETFLKTWIYISKGEKIQNLKAFLYKVANNLVIDEFKKRKELKLEEITMKKIIGENDFKERSHANIEAEDVIKLINSLDPKYQKVVIMRYIDSLSIKEIADILGKTENNISVRLHRALNQIKKIMHYEQRI